MVFQDSFMFRGTIWENLTYGQPNATCRDGLQAAKAAGAHDFICRAGLAYETPLGESGAGLSGGEKQRLSIARTLLYDPKILVLDEATSNIDAEAEKAIQQALEALVKGRTTIAIAHRLSTLRNADRILVFDRGRLIEQGTHAQLLTLDGTYARLVRLQTQISKDPSVDKLIAFAPQNSNHQTHESKLEADQPALVADHHVQHTMQPKADLGSLDLLNWLQPGEARFTSDSSGTLSLGIDKRPSLGVVSSDVPQVHTSVFAVACFPATRPESYVSIRAWNEKDEEIEIGLIEDLSLWPIDQQQLVRRSLAQRYLLPRIRSIESIQLMGGYLDFKATTERGPVEFTLRWSQNQAIDFNERGKLLIDTEDNRFVVPDLATLPRADRDRFQQYIYW
jgi:ABC-type multidrug transport system ATPase subunit